MLTLITRQIYDHLLSVRFQLGFLVLFAFFTATSALYDLRLESLQRDMARVHADNEARFDDFTSVSKMLWQSVRVQADPPGTEFIAEGHIEHLSNATWIFPRSGYISDPDHAITSNDVLLPFDHVDWTWIVRYVLSFLCIVLAFDALSGERESGTLRLLMANPLSRLSVVAAKCLANVVVLVGSLIAVSAFSLFYLSLMGAIQLNATIWAGYTTFLFIASVYTLLFTTFAVGVSAVSGQSSTSVVVLILAWATFIVIIPQTSALIASQAVEEDTNRWSAWDVIGEEYDNLSEEGIVLRGRDAGAIDDYAMERTYGRRVEQATEQAHQNLREIEARVSRRFALARNVSLLSPGSAMQYPMETLLGTGVVWRDHMHEQAERYRYVLREFLQQQDAADPDSPHILFQPEYMSKADMDPDLIPRFQPVPLDMATRLREGLVPLLALFGQALAAILFAGWAAQRMEIATQ